MNALKRWISVGHGWGQAMGFRGSFRGVMSLALAGGAMMASATGASITATYRNIADVVAGVDRWEVEYLVAGHAFGAGEGFTVFFDFSGYSNLEIPPLPTHPGWDVLLIQPETSPVGLDGLQDGLAVVANPSVGDPFVVRFDWSGTGRPGSQAFQIYVLDPFSVLEDGQTSVVYAPSDPGVPDGGATHLQLGMGAMMLIAWARWIRGAQASGHWALARRTER